MARARAIVAHCPLWCCTVLGFAFRTGEAQEEKGEREGRGGETRTKSVARFVVCIVIATYIAAK